LGIRENPRNPRIWFRLPGCPILGVHRPGGDHLLKQVNKQVERAQVTENIGPPPRLPSVTGASVENKALASFWSLKLSKMGNGVPAPPPAHFTLWLLIHSAYYFP
jgi:hypothetical protein